MGTEKDGRNKLIGKIISIFLILIIGIIGFVGYQLIELTRAAHDVDVVTQFSDIYYYEGTQNS